MGSLSDNYIINNKEILLDIMIQLITLNSCNFSIRFMPKEGCHFFYGVAVRKATQSPAPPVSCSFGFGSSPILPANLYLGYHFVSSLL